MSSAVPLDAMVVAAVPVPVHGASGTAADADPAVSSRAAAVNDRSDLSLTLGSIRPH